MKTISKLEAAWKESQRHNREKMAAFCSSQGIRQPTIIAEGEAFGSASYSYSGESEEGKAMSSACDSAYSLALSLNAEVLHLETMLKERDQAEKRAAEERIRIANETGVIKFSSGRTMEPNAGIIGLSPELEVYEGFDSAVDSGPGDIPLPEDLSELADIMIDRWQRFKASLGEKA